MIRAVGLRHGVVVLWLPCLAYAGLAGPDALLRFFPDDAFYYLQPAWNLAHTGRATFDGVHATNGFHPLNFVLVWLLAVGRSKAALVPLTFAVHTLLPLSAAALAVAHFAARRSPAVQMAALVTLTSPVVLLFVYLSTGLEAGLVVLSIVLVAIAVARAAEAGWRDGPRLLQLGAALTLLMLSRLDAVLAAGPIVGGVFIAMHRREPGAAAVPRLPTMAAIVAMPIVVLSLYLAINAGLTGYVVPVSGHVKGGMALGADTWRPSTGGTVAGTAYTLWPIAVVAASVAVASRRLLARGADARDLAAALTGVGALTFAGYLAFGVAHVFRWYFAVPIGAAVVGGAHLVATFSSDDRAAMPGGWRAAAGWLVTGVAATAACLTWIGSRPASVSYQLGRVSALVNRHGGPGAITGTMDAGVIGYFATGRVINLDGLANDFEYLERFLRPRRLTEYFAREGVTHLLVRDALLANAAEVATGAYAEARLTLDPRVRLPRDHEVFRYQIPGQFAVYYFRLPGLRSATGRH